MHTHTHLQFAIPSMETVQDQIKNVVSTPQIIHNTVNNLLKITVHDPANELTYQFKINGWCLAKCLATLSRTKVIWQYKKHQTIQ